MDEKKVVRLDELVLNGAFRYQETAYMIMIKVGNNILDCFLSLPSLIKLNYLRFRAAMAC